MCLPIEGIRDFEEASATMTEIDKIYNRIRTNMLSFPNTEFPDNEFNGINPCDMINFVEHVPGSALIDFHGKKLPGSMDFLHVMVASNLDCTNFLQKIEEF